ncbi:FAD-dependent oxidoreductase [Nonomuraea sp. NPDC026600]|uniref:FAD-dependent oxidoreductase n=1 Tax=Nonomuraea sp. NPDC026600 TaxID=3155363 RepID=UPI0033C016E7
MRKDPPRAAVIGAGPSGFYTAEQLLGSGFEVDLIDALPTPYGLVRAGVAPDHQKIKGVTRVYARIAGRPGFRFFGGVELGRHLTRDELLERFHAVVYAVGAADDNRLGVPGEDRPGSHPATEFVAWYNGHPDFADRGFGLSAKRAVVIGNGNVALDAARMLVADPAELARTDIADHALRALERAAVREVVVLGRRGPAQASFTDPELRELGELPRADVVVDPAAVQLDPHSAAWLESGAADAGTRRNMEILREYAWRPLAGKTHRVVLTFSCSPVEILGGQDGSVSGVRVVRNRIELGADGRLYAVPTGQEEVIECGLVLRSIGYRGRPLPGVPFDERRGVIRNAGGRVLGDDGAPLPGEYAAGWIKRGPSGVIGTNKKDAADTVARIAEDAEAGALNEPARPDAGEIAAWLAGRVPDLVRWGGWEAIDRHEVGRGEPLGRPRVKIVRRPEMVGVALGTSSQTRARDANCDVTRQ